MRHNNCEFECGTIFAFNSNFGHGVMINGCRFLTILRNKQTGYFDVEEKCEIPADAKPLGKEEIRLLGYETRLALKSVWLITQKTGVKKFSM